MPNAVSTKKQMTKAEREAASAIVAAQPKAEPKKAAKKAKRVEAPKPVAKVEKKADKVQPATERAGKDETVKMFADARSRGFSIRDIENGVKGTAGTSYWTLRCAENPKRDETLAIAAFMSIQNFLADPKSKPTKPADK